MSCVFVLLPLTTYAGKITLQLTEQTETASGTLCRHSNSINDKLITVKRNIAQAFRRSITTKSIGTVASPWC